MSKYRDVEKLINNFKNVEDTAEQVKDFFSLLADLLEDAPKKGKNTIVETGDILIRDGKRYEVVIADDNIFVICPINYNKAEQCDTVNYVRAEIYANQSNINTLEELHFTEEERGR